MVQCYIALPGLPSQRLLLAKFISVTGSSEATLISDTKTINGSPAQNYIYLTVKG